MEKTMLYIASVALFIAAVIFWLTGISGVIAACFGVAGLYFLASAISKKTPQKSDNHSTPRRALSVIDA